MDVRVGARVEARVEGVCVERARVKEEERGKLSIIIY
jgi:hypothetical protein